MKLPISSTLSANPSWRRRLLTALCTVAVLAATAGVALAAAPSTGHAGAATIQPRSINAGELYSLSVPGVTGEGTRGTGNIEVDSWSWGVSRTALTGTGVSAAAKSAPLVIVRQIDKASPGLYRQCVVGTIDKTVTLYVQPITASGDVLSIQLNNAHVTNVSWNGAGGGDRPTESVTFVYTASKITYSTPIIIG
jgi:type VI protein secretion system component Hcp